MGVLINYDLDGKHTPVKDAMREKGYQDYFDYNDIVDGRSVRKRIKLPNTELYHANKGPAEARDELKIVAKSKGAKLERALATTFNPETTGWASYS